MPQTFQSLVRDAADAAQAQGDRASAPSLFDDADAGFETTEAYVPPWKRAAAKSGGSDDRGFPWHLHEESGGG
eukprot:CAMPEP_0115142720 /NCGR_PEP_ID=MMETSP0227-20121206/60329_1 /TAXON_ID=89957 /ORGANISM="Polarella glacialis, Strain CCMP 1383" /LENGTH=72 /DNA_ID=CAMNT_0002551383 /DNA_START=39 /DNA_END=254 /DNA_ORIENTATION=+